MNRLPMVRLLVVGLLVNFPGSLVIAGQDTVTDYAGVALPADMQLYVIPMQNCAIKFFARKGGRTSAYVGDLALGSFNHERYFPNYKNQPSLSLNFSCYLGQAKELCPELLPVESPENTRYYNVRRLESVHLTYFNIAQISSFSLNSSFPGQVRKLNVCLGDNAHTLATDNGGIELGYDTRDVSETPGKKLQSTSETALPATLEIIRSIRFLPADSE